MQFEETQGSQLQRPQVDSLAKGYMGAGAYTPTIAPGARETEW